MQLGRANGYFSIPTAMTTGPFVIRAAQMKAFDVAERDRLRRDIVAHLRKKVPAARDATTEQLEELARQGMSSCGKHGIKIEWDVCRYVEYMARLGPTFDVDQAWAREIFASSRTGTSKMDHIDHHFLNRIA